MHRKIAFLSLGLYGLSLAFYGLSARGDNPYGFEGYRGIQCLLMGWITVLGGLRFFLPWTANLVYPVGLILLLFPRPPRRLGLAIPVLGLIIALTTFRIDTVMVNEAGHRAAVQPGMGAWLWILSFVVLIVGFSMPRGPRASPLSLD